MGHGQREALSSWAGRSGCHGSEPATGGEARTGTSTRDWPFSMLRFQMTLGQGQTVGQLRVPANAAMLARHAYVCCRKRGRHRVTLEDQHGPSRGGPGSKWNPWSQWWGFVQKPRTWR